MNPSMMENLLFWITLPFLTVFFPIIVMFIFSFIRDVRARKKTQHNGWNKG
ncbi:hypothetical protein Rin_00009730 [Candidatus Regiella insecticola 5.15]|uniref:Uncharacterized protein n=1 Tax=Candidatus Regiella insecticola 5.15 TaxID=1005043 RepID=G2GYW3_9ENTR|nr:hypothetical protein Rin_00009730 [Candidatus Regiella insecticola 5.15]